MAAKRRVWLWVILGLVGFGFLSCTGLAFVAVSLSNKSDGKKDGVLVLKLEGELPDHAARDPFLELLSDRPVYSFSDVMGGLKKAAVDPKIKGVLLRVEQFGGGWGKAEELREAIGRFRATAKKPIYAELGSPGNLEYFVASACDKVWLAPAGTLFVQGLAAEVTFFRGTLDKIGVYPDVFAIGKYKNAPDSYTRTGMTDAHREVMNSILDQRFEQLVQGIAESRKLSPEQVRAAIDAGPLTAPDALAATLVDELLFPPDVEIKLAQEFGYDVDEPLPKVKFSKYREVSPQSLGLEKGPEIAVIYASGAIGTGDSENDGSGQSTGSDTVVKALEKARLDDDIKAVVLRVDSPGGSAFASDLIWGAAEKLKAKKPIVVSMGDLAASGGYYISANANRIVADKATLTGSIGIFGGKPVLKDLFDKIGISSETLLRGKNAGLFRATERFTPEERMRFEGLLRHAYEKDFLPKVAQGRGKEVSYIDSIAQGRVWTGSQGLENGLVDEIGGMEHAIAVAKGLANIPESADPKRVVLPAPKTFLMQLMDPEENAQSALAAHARQAKLEALPEPLRPLMQYAWLLERMSNREVLALLPFEINIR